jgi:hypothetical protein
MKLAAEFSNFMQMNQRNADNKAYAKIKYDVGKQLIVER